MVPLLAPLASTLGWVSGSVVGVVVLLYALRLLRGMARRRVPWWPSFIGLALSLGPALGLLVSAAAEGRPLGWGSGPEHLASDVAWSLLVFFGVWTGLGLVRAFLTSPFVIQRLGLNLPDLVLDAARYLLLLCTLFFVVAAIWGRPDLLSVIFTASAVGTVILGFALQETLANFFAGMSLVSERAYAVGDWVWVGDVEGEVVAISRRATRLKTRAGDIVTLANRSVASGVLRNLSKPTPLHAELLQVSAPYEAPPNRVREVLRAAIEDVPGVLHDPPPLFRLRSFEASSIAYEVKLWLQDVQRLHDIRSDCMVQIWYHFQRAAIPFPYPVVEHHPFQRAVGTEALAAEKVYARLASAALFQALPAQALEVLARGAHAVEVSAGERIVRQGAAGRSCFVVDEGRVTVSVEDAGATRTVATLAAGDLFGEMSLLTGQDRSASVRALTDARLVEVEASALREALELAPELAATLAHLAAERREGTTAARAALSAEASQRLRESAQHLGTLIRQFFRLPPPRPGAS